MRGRDPWKIRSAGGHSEGEGEANEIMHRIADHGLIKVTHLNCERAVCAGDRSEISDMTVAADPYVWTVWEQSITRGVQPFIKPHGAPAHIGVGRSGHLAVAFGG